MSNKLFPKDTEISEETVIRREFLEQEYKEYIQSIKLSNYEKRLLRNWVAEGHSVYESPGSKYLPTVYPPATFIDTYREDRAIEKELRGKSIKEREKYLKSYIGWDDDAKQPDVDIESLKQRIIKKNREIFYLWSFILAEGLWEDANAYVEENINDPTPFEVEW